MSIKLRDYQEVCIGEVRIALRQFRNVLLQSPTGSGKTAMATHMLSNVKAKQKRGFFICHRRELVDQTAKTFDKFGLPYGYIAAGIPPNFHQQIQICSIDTLKNRVDKVPTPDFCIWDEAHHLGAAGWTAVHEYYSRAYHVGLSATPQRLDGKGLDDRFDHLVRGPEVSWLIDNGMLAEYKLYSIPGVDMSGVHTRMGDFVKAESENAMDKRAITGNIISHWKKHAQDKLTIGFAVSVKHSLHIVEQFKSEGVRAAHIDAKTSREERRSTLRAFARGEIQVLFNVALFAEGFDIAANSGMDVTVGAVIDAAPTQSLGSWLQRCGRALRPQDDHAIILDHAGNAARHGLPCQKRNWTLKGREVGSKFDSESKDPEVRMKQCPECFHNHKPMPACPDCGHVYAVTGRVVDEVDGELTEVDVNEARQQARKEQGQAKTLDELRALAESRGKNPAMADHILRARQEKKALQERLFNLSVGVRQINLHPGFTKNEIFKMKPKELKGHISDLEKAMDPGVGLEAGT